MHSLLYTVTRPRPSGLLHMDLTLSLINLLDRPPWQYAFIIMVLVRDEMSHQRVIGVKLTDCHVGQPGCLPLRIDDSKM